MRFLPKARISAFFQSRSIKNSASTEENTNLRAFDQKVLPLLQAMAVFAGVVLALVLTYVMRDGGFHMEYSISRYVGREWWSATVFALGNFVIVWEVYRYTRVVWKEYGKVWLALMVVMLVCYVGLSLCPLGLFDSSIESLGAVSVLHQIFARGMFMTMAVIGFVKGVKLFGRDSKVARWCLLYVALAIVLGVMSFTTQIFWDLNFVIETAYIYLFMIMLML